MSLIKLLDYCTTNYGQTYFLFSNLIKLSYYCTLSAAFLFFIADLHRVYTIVNSLASSCVSVSILFLDSVVKWDKMSLRLFLSFTPDLWR